METHLAEFIASTPEGQEADSILRACVHCGFCTATCPTYQLLGDELDGPRGRIYLIKQVLEGAVATESTRTHLDRCLTCRSCESTCPSGVAYGRLVDIGRNVVEQRATTPRPLGERLARSAIKTVTTRRWLFDPAMRMGQSVRPLLPKVLKDKVPARRPPGQWPRQQHERKMLMLEGCVQPAMMPNINSATARVFDAAGVTLERASAAGCCGAIEHHLADPHASMDRMRRNIDAWIPYLDAGIDTIVINASGCTAMLKDYGVVLAHDPAYAEKARRVTEASRDLSEVVAALMPALLPKIKRSEAAQLAFHPPCSLQHGLKIRGVVESIMTAAGFEVKLARDSHLCCGSAGTYSMLQPEIATRLQQDKLDKLAETHAPCIVTANIGCISHLQNGTNTPVRHWIEVLDSALGKTTHTQVGDGSFGLKR